MFLLVNFIQGWFHGAYLEIFAWTLFSALAPRVFKDLTELAAHVFLGVSFKQTDEELVSSTQTFYI